MRTMRALPVVLLLGLAACGTEVADPAAAPSPTAEASGMPSHPQETTVKDDSPRSTQAELDQRLRDAAWKDDVSRARALIANGADVNAKDETEQSAYLISTSEGYLDLLRLTLRHGGDVGSHDSYDGTGLIRAAERGHWRIVGELLRADVAPDHVNNLGWTALHEAVLLGQHEARALATVRVLVAGGVDVTIPAGRDGRTARQYAEQRGFTGISRLLGQVGQDRPGDATDRLLRAAAGGDADAAALALRDGASLEARDEHRRTPLLLASAADHVDVAQVLVASGADPDAVDDRHDTPWLVTGVTGSVPMGKVLLTSRPDLTARNRYGGVSVIPASERGHVDYVRWVVHTSIDVNHVNDLGWTALLEAVILGDGSAPYQEIARILLAAGADPSIADRDGVTALDHAVQQGQTDVAGILRAAASG